MPSRTLRDDALVVLALVRLSYEYEEDDPEISSMAWNLAVDYSMDRQKTPDELITAIDRQGNSSDLLGKRDSLGGGRGSHQ
jgi:hypothetical protein